MIQSESSVSKDLDHESFEVLSKHAKSFRWAALFLARGARRDAAILYAFCRKVDDIVDEGASPAQAETELSELERDVARELPLDPLVARFREIAIRRRFGLTPALDLIAGMRSDLRRVRVRSSEELELYCYRAAGTVGLMMSGVLGVTRPEAQHYAVSLGMAMQLTNICRDVAEDMDRDRLYLPETKLREHGCDPGQLMQGAVRRDWDRGLAERLSGTVIALLARAEDLYGFASHGFKMIPWRSRLAVLTAALLYREIGRELMRSQAGNPLLGRVVVSPVRKLRLLSEAFLRLIASRFTLSKKTFALSTSEDSLGAPHIDPYLRLPLS